MLIAVCVGNEADWCVDCAVPDKAIDLVDEACANSRVQLDSVPEDIDAMQRQRYRLQVEEKALSKEKDKVSTKGIP